MYNIRKNNNICWRKYVTAPDTEKEIGNKMLSLRLTK